GPHPQRPRASQSPGPGLRLRDRHLREDRLGARSMPANSLSVNWLFDNKLVKWVDERLPIFSTMQHAAIEYPAPRNLSYWWNFGSLAGFMLVVMIVTGIFLGMHYTPHVDHAFASVERIMRDVNYGWLIRYIHMNGASMFFIVVYIHMFRGLYYGSY